MSNAPSFDDLKDSDYFHVSLKATSFNFNESSQMFDNKIDTSSFVYFSCDIDNDDGKALSSNSVRVELNENRSGDRGDSKYPFGFAKFYDEEVTIRIFCRESLISKVCSMAGLNVEIFVTLPILPSERPNLYPILEYQVRVDA